MVRLLLEGGRPGGPHSAFVCANYQALLLLGRSLLVQKGWLQISFPLGVSRQPFKSFLPPRESVITNGRTGFGHPGLKEGGPWLGGERRRSQWLLGSFF